MFETVPQKKLKTLHLVLLGLYFLIAFGAPVALTIGWCCSSNLIKESHRFPLIIIIIIAIFAILAMQFLKKSVDKIRVLNLDGSYSKKAVKVKIALKFVCSAIVPLVLILACFITKEWLTETVEEMHQYLDIIACNLAFVVGAKLLDAWLIDPIEFELDLRDKVSSEQAVQRRINNLNNIQ